MEKRNWIALAIGFILGGMGFWMERFIYWLVIALLLFSAPWQVIAAVLLGLCFLIPIIKGVF